MKLLIRVLLPILVIGGLIFWRIDQELAEKAAQNRTRAARRSAPAVVSLAPVEIRDIVHQFQGTGSVEAPLSVKVAPKITGRIDFLEVNEGDIVRKGQVLARIDSQEIEADVQRAAAEVAADQYRLAQAQLSANPTDVGINTQISQQAAAVASATADLKQAQATLNSLVAASQANVNEALAKVESAKAAVSASLADLTNAKVKRDRVAKLFDKGYAPAQDVDNANAEVAVQQADLEVSNAQLKAAQAQVDSARQQLSTTKSRGEADVAAARADLSKAKDALKFARANTAQKGAYRQSIAALRASVTAAQSALASAKARRAYTVLASPLDGFVTSRSVDPGAIASPSQPVLTVESIRQVWINVPVPDVSASDVRLGQRATAVFDAFAGRVFQAKVIQINPAADPQSRQFTVRIAIDNEGSLLRPGMFARVSVETRRDPDQVVVPREALKSDPDGDYVIVVAADEKAQRRSVVKGGEDEKYVSIRSGVQVGEKVVVMTNLQLRDGQNVTTGGEKDRRQREREGVPGGPGGARRGADR